MTQQECIFALAAYAAEVLQLRAEKTELVALLSKAEEKVTALRAEAEAAADKLALAP